MLGREIREYLPRWTAASGQPFTPYTIPGYELRRVLAEVRLNVPNESFQLSYDVLPGVLGNESWRRSAKARTVQYSEDGKGGRRCLTRKHGGFGWESEFIMGWRECEDGEIVLQPPPSWWGLTSYLMVWFPYPILPELEGEEVMPCMD